VEGSLALKFLAAGARAVVGSTTMAYGSIEHPLLAADLLGAAFWQALRDGAPAGEALRRAKIFLVREMQARQGYLDGEDQKTLISFILYGDPLAQPDGRPAGNLHAKAALRLPKVVKTVCDRAQEGADAGEPAPVETLEYVRHVVSRYLPGMEDARVAIAQEHARCEGGSHVCPSAQIKSIAHPESDSGRKVITLSKHITNGAARVHSRYARLTLDGHGKLVKLVVSR
jgi:hypothetical protein